MSPVSDDFLLVPMELDVMVLSQPSLAATPFCRFEMRYQNLANWQSAEPAPFQTNAQPPSPGACLHWTLPKALRHGIQNPGVGTSFPLVPNRWIVTRLRQKPGAAPDVKAWVLESDYVWPTAAAGNHADAGSAPFYDSTNGPQKMGRARLLTPAITTLAGQGTLFLQAIAAGNPYFSVYAPSCPNVFSFVDDMTELDGMTPIAAATFTYLVAGWYSDPAQDPIHDAKIEWAASPAGDGTWNLQDLPPTAQVTGAAKVVPEVRFDWRVRSSSAAGLPRKTLLVAQSSGVPWDRSAPATPPRRLPQNVPGTVKVAIGNTGVDALAALINTHGDKQAEADLLQAFQYGMLEAFDEPGSAEALNMAVRKHWFGFTSGGTRWSVVPVERAGDTSTAAPAPAPLSPAAQSALAACNSMQMECDRQKRILDSMQWTLYSLWWKEKFANAPLNMPPIKDDFLAQLALQLGKGSAASTAPQPFDPTQETWHFFKVKAQVNLLKTMQTSVDSAKADLLALLDPATQRIKSSELQSFCAANDPVILVSGLNRSSRFDPQDGLLCRLSSQMVTALTVAGTRYSTTGSGGTDIRKLLPVFSDPNSVLPACLPALVVESFLLSPWLFAATVLGDTHACPSDIVQPPPDPLCDSVRASYAAPAAPFVDGILPAAAAMPEWSQPWVPLLLDWQVTVLRSPAYAVNAAKTECILQQANWKFDGRDFVWCGPVAAAGEDFDPSLNQMQLSGRTFVTPQVTHTLANQLKTYVQKHAARDPNIAALLTDLEAQLGAVAGQDVLSQRLSGLMSAMVQRSYAQTPAPTPEIAPLLGDLHHGHPAPWPDDKTSEAAPPWNFGPASGTFFVFNKLTVMDTFGRTVDLMLANGNTCPGDKIASDQEFYFYPITSPGMTPTGFPPAPRTGRSANALARMVQLPPRLVQEARLRIDLLANDGSDTDIHLKAGANPVCGWVLPNHLNRSLAVYDSDGAALGELYYSQSGATAVPMWTPDPTNPTAPKDVASISSYFLRNMLLGLVNLNDDGIGFTAFLDAVDETTWTINPRGRRQDQDLSVLIGRPLALVRAQATLRIKGLPFTTQDWDATFDMSLVDPNGAPAAPLIARTGQIDEMVWPVLLGSQGLRDDGLVGYFVEDPADLVGKTTASTWSAFHAVRVPGDAPKSSYVQAISPDNCLSLRLTDDTLVDEVVVNGNYRGRKPDKTKQEIAYVTMLVDPRGSVHAFSGLLPVASITVPPEFVTKPLGAMSYLFRVGPLLTPPDSVRLPKPAERKGTWTWFDEVTAQAVPLMSSDGKARMPTVSPLVKEGWLKLTRS